MSNDRSAKRGYHIEMFTDLVVYAASVVAGLVGLAKGYPELLAVPVVVYVSIAFNPCYGRFRHVWD